MRPKGSTVQASGTAVAFTFNARYWPIESHVPVAPSVLVVEQASMLRLGGRWRSTESSTALARAR